MLHLKVVECRGVEPLTSSMPLKRATNCANTPYAAFISHPTSQATSANPVNNGLFTQFLTTDFSLLFTPSNFPHRRHFLYEGVKAEFFLTQQRAFIDFASAFLAAVLIRSCSLEAREMDALKTRHQNILDVENALLVVVDVQERFRGHIDQYDNLIGSVATLVRGVERLGVPVLVTEQYPRGLGNTVKEIKEIEGPPDAISSEQLRQVFEKVHFSAAVAPDFVDRLKAHGRNQIIICGIETHVCVNQTVHDLLNLGYQVHVVVDAVASRTTVNKENGLAKMFASGAIPATVEMVLFELLVKSGTAQFKQVQSLVK